MNEEAPRLRISCPGCGRRLDWKPEYAGQQLSCVCGAKFLGKLGASEILSTSNPYDIHAGETRKSGHVRAVDKPAFGDPRFPSKRLPPRAGRAAHEMLTEEDVVSPVRELYLPIILLVGGIALRFMQTSAQNPNEPGRAVAMTVFGLMMTFVAWVVAAATLSALLGNELHQPVRSGLKLLSVAVIATVATCFLARLDHDPNGIRGMVIGLQARPIVAFVLLTYLFRLDLQEGLWMAMMMLLAQLCVCAATIKAIGAPAARHFLF